MNKKVLVLGATGMLGSMVHRFLSSQPDLDVVGTWREHDPKSPLIFFDAHDFLRTGLAPNGFDFAVNCIALTKPHCPDNDPAGIYQALQINSLLPLELSNFCGKNGTKLIHISTDGVFSGRNAPYDESSTPDPTDVYGKSKLLGEINHPACLNIRCSILGPDPSKKQGLLEWVLGQKPGSTINGFSNHIWNGVTTLEFSKLCLALMRGDVWQSMRKEHHLHHFAPQMAISKFDLCKLINELFNCGLTIQRASSDGVSCDRTLKSHFSGLANNFRTKNYPESLAELRSLMAT